MSRPQVDVDALAAAIRRSERAALAKAITLVESKRADHREAAQRLLLELLPHTGAGERSDGKSGAGERSDGKSGAGERSDGKSGAGERSDGKSGGGERSDGKSVLSHRVGITGVPGVGKSTFIDSLGMHLIEKGHRVAVLAVDPSSTRTHGSILGDKTRMARLAVERNAYIRPSPTSGTLGGVAKATRQTIVLLEAAGYDVILVETVGVGQSEVTVANMVDVFCFLTLARTGDQLQGIKKGVLELADIVAVNKADGNHIVEARVAARELRGALRLIHPHDALWKPPVLTMSGLEGSGLDEFWNTVLEHRKVLTDAGEFEENRRRQKVDWTWTMVHEQVLGRLSENANVKAIRADVEKQVRGGLLTSALAAQRILAAFDRPAGDGTRQVTVRINRSAPDVAAVAGDPARLHEWAGGLARTPLQRRDDRWVADSPMGEVSVKFVPANDFGVLDHDVTLPDGTVVTNPFRVVPDGPDACEAVFTVRKRDGMTDEEFDADCAAVAADLARLRDLVAD